jgi:HK97 family phage major capsid protein
MTMSKLTQLREQRDVKAREANAINAKYPADKRMEKADADKLDGILAEIEGIDGDIARCVKVDSLGELKTPEQETNAAMNAATRTPGAHGNTAEAKALRAYLTAGINGLSKEQLGALNARVNPDIRAAMSTTTGSEGGYTTAPEYVRDLLQAQAEFGGMRGIASQIATATGTQMLWPTTDATAEQGEIVGQNGGVALGESTFGQTTLDVYKYSSKKIAIPFELLQDSFFDIEAYIKMLLAIRIARIQAIHHTTGTGTGQPSGVVVGSAAGKVGTTGQTLTFIYDDLVDLEHSVDPAYRNRPGVGFMMHDSSLKVARKIKDSQARPIFVPGYEQGNPGGAPDRLLGRPVYVNQQIAAMAANAKSILFGDYKNYLIRDVMDLTLFRMTDSAFTLNGQVGFVAFQRSGGKLVSAGQPIKYYQNSAT